VVDEGDITLPMPCGLSMTFRLVAVKAKRLIDEQPMKPGVDSYDADRAFYDRRFTASIAAPLRFEDLPPDWKGTPDSGHYLIAKYEVTNLQWRAVMEGEAIVGPDSAKPKTDVSWYEAVEFTRKYSEWLLENASDKLPRPGDSDRTATFVRLPTETEWEYAARGGQMVGPDSLLQEDFFPMEKGRPMSDYAVYRSGNASQGAEGLASIGSRAPNPLKLYDTAGNAAEMVLDPFHLSVGGRLHGSSGGFVRKGGSFQDDEQQILPGRREEAAFFQADGPHKASDMGFRPVLSAVNVPDRARQEQLEKEWKSAGETLPPVITQKAAFTPDMNPVTVLDKLIEQTADPVGKKKLNELRATLMQHNVILARQRQEYARSLLRSGVYIIESLRNYNSRRGSMRNQITEIDDDMKKATVKGTKDKLLVLRRKAQEGYDMMDTSFAKCFAFYRSKLEESKEVLPAELKDAGDALTKDFAGTDPFNVNMRENLTLFLRHMSAQSGLSPMRPQDMEAEILKRRYN
jgi:hypothetical protein